MTSTKPTGTDPAEWDAYIAAARSSADMQDRIGECVAAGVDFIDLERQQAKRHVHAYITRPDPAGGEPLPRLGPDAEFIGAGDEVAIIDPVLGGITHTGIVVNIDEAGVAIVNAETEADPGNGIWVEVDADQLVHIDSPAAEAAAQFGRTE